ncbi:MAG: polyprenyl synthetase family protein [Endozoicomonadaceae bacterium]|nr:polyprenyl synthetase family protein [Endozoicomonadaceae bacterium]
MLQTIYKKNNALQELYAPVTDELNQVNAFIHQHLQSTVPLINDIEEHIFLAQSKHLRPLLVLLSAKACGYHAKQHISLAAAIEFLHTATLLHDDVVDTSSMRRGRYTANYLWNNASSVLVGDFIYSRAFQLMVQTGNMEVMKILAQATNTIAEGEVLQLTNLKNIHLSCTEYMDVIYRKTAVLFEVSSHAAAILSNASDEIIRGLKAFGRHLGIAFQLTDDILDYTGDEKIMGKNLGDDIAEGKMTLPLIYVVQNGSPAEVALVKNAVTKCDASCINDIIDVVLKSGSVDYTLSIALKEEKLASEALACLPDSEYRKALKNLALFSVNRNK